MKTKNTPVPNNYSLFGVNYSDNCRTTRQLLVFPGKLLVFTFNYSFFTTIPDSLKLSVNYPKLDSTIRFRKPTSRKIAN